MLQHEFGIGAHEAMYERPAWELDNLLTQYVKHRQAEEEG